MIVSEPTARRAARPAFTDFVAGAEPRLRRALVARYGGEVGREATAEALAYAWEHWDRVGSMENPLGYLYRVGQSKSRRSWRKRVGFPAPADHGMPWVEPGLPAALASLTSHQRQAVVLVHAFGYTHAEVAALLGLSRTTIQNHVERGLEKLRRRLEVSDV